MAAPRKTRRDVADAPLAERMLRHKILTREEERALLVAAGNGDRTARDALVESNLRFVASFARKYGPRCGLEADDAFQEGAIGQIKAIGRFKVETGNRLSTYASWWVRQGVQRAGQDTARTIRLPVPVLEGIRVIMAAKADAEAVGVDLDPAAIAEATGYTTDEVARLLAAAATTVASLDAPISDDGRTLAEMCGDPSTGAEAADANVADQERRFAIGEALRTLTPTEAAVIECRFERDLTLDQTAAAVIGLTGGRRVSRERIRQIEMKALNKMRAALDADPR